MSEIKLFIAGLPVGKGRPRFARRGNYVTAYTPEKTRAWEQVVKDYCTLNRPRQTPQGPAIVYLTFILPRPKSLPKKITHHTKKPDLDNLAKAVLDAMQGSFFVSDSQITSLALFKTYGERPGVEITFRELQPTEQK